MLQQIEDDAGIESPRACPHRQAVDRGETHCHGDAAPAIDSAHAGAIAEMRDYELFPGAIGHELGECRNDVFIGEPMETVPSNPLFGELARQCEFLRQRRLAAMERGVEAGDLRHLRSNRADGTNRADVMGLVQWGERYQAFEHGHDLAIDQHRL